VREVLDAVALAAGQPLTIREEPRRAGDPPILVAEATRVREVLDWTPRYDKLEQLVQRRLALGARLG
jgi:UDP-glucose 4-epimerase